LRDFQKDRQLQWNTVMHLIASICEIPPPEEARDPYYQLPPDLAYLADFIASLCGHAEQTPIVVQTRAAVETIRPQHGDIRKEINNLRMLIAAIEARLTTKINLYSASGPSTVSPIQVSRLPDVLVRRTWYRFRFERQLYILGIYGAVEEVYPVPGRKFPLRNITDKTPAVWVVESELIPNYYKYSRVVADITITPAQFNALPTTARLSSWDTGTYPISQTWELAPGIAARANGYVPTTTRTLDYLEQSKQSELIGVITGAAWDLAQNFPVIGDALGYADTAVSVAGSITSAITPDAELWRDSEAPFGVQPKVAQYTDGDAVIYHRELGFLSAKDSLLGGVLPLEAAAYNPFNTVSTTTQKSEWVTDDEFSVFGGDRGRMFADVEVITGVRGFSSSQFANGAATAVYDIKDGVSYPTDYAENGSEATGWNVVFLDDRPWAIWDGLGWQYRNDILIDETR
jgi:hypothetical protein